MGDFEEKVKHLENFVKDEQKAFINKSQEINQEILTIKSATNAFSQKVEGFSKDHQMIINNIEERVKQNEDQIKHIDDTLDGLHRTVHIIDQKHVDTASSFSNELDQKIKEVGDNFTTKLSKYESINRDSFDKIETQIQESTFIQAEKVQYVESLESKVNQIGEEHQKLEQQTKEDLKASIENNTKQILQLKSEIDTTLSDIRRSVSQESDIHKSERDIFVGQINNVSNNIEKLNQQYNAIIAANKIIETDIAKNIKYSEDKFNQQEELIQNSLVNYQELLEGKLREVGEETKMNSNSLVEIVPVAKSFDSRLDMLQNSNTEKMEVLKEQILVENTHRIESFKSEVSSSLVSVSEKNESVEKHIQVFKDSSDQIKTEIYEMISKEHDLHQQKLSAIIKENELVSNNIKSTIDEQLSVISNNISGHQEQLNSINSNISSLVNKIEDIETIDVKQNALLSNLGEQGNSLENKPSSLESADQRLQEANRIHTEKTSDIEKECKRIEETFVKFYTDQRQEIDSNIKVTLNSLQTEKENSKEIMENILNRINLSESKITEMEKYSQNSNETIVLNMQEKLEKASSDRTAELENTVMLYYQQMGANTEKIKEINSISSTLESKLQSL